MNNIRLITLLISAAFITGNAFAQSSSAVNVKDAIAKAVTTSPDVQSRWHTFQASIEEQKAAHGGFFPKVDLSATTGRERRERPGIPNSLFNRTGAALTVDQLLFDGFGTSSEYNRLGYAKLASYYDLLDTSESTAYEAFRAYEDVQRYRELVRMAKDNFTAHREIFTQIEQRVAAGVGARIDYETAAGRLALAESNLLTETSNLHDVSVRYQRVVGELPSDSLQDVQLAATVLPKDKISALRSALTYNPQLNAAFEAIRAAKKQAEGAQAGYYPQFNVRGTANGMQDRDGIDGRSTDGVIELVMNYNLFRGGADYARTKQFAERMNVAVEQRDLVCREVRQNLAIAYNDVARLGEQLKYLDQHQLSIAKAREAYRQQFDIGQRTLLDLLDTENEYFDSRRAFANGVYDKAIAEARVLSTMGNLLRTVGVSRSDIPTASSLGQDREGLDPEASCPVETVTPVVIAKDPLPPPPSIGPAPAPGPQALPQSDLTNRVRDWAATWARKDIPGYFAFYSAAFKPEKRASLASWNKARTRLVGKKGPITVEVADIRTQSTGPNSATTTFSQKYNSNDFRDNMVKTLDWVNENGTWLIVRETNR